MKLEVKQFDPIQEFEAEAQRWCDKDTHECCNCEGCASSLAKLLHDVYTRGITDGMEMGRMEQATEKAITCEGSVNGKHCHSCTNDNVECCLCGSPAVRIEDMP